MSEPTKPSGGQPFTIVVIVTSVLGAVFTRFGEDKKQRVLQGLFIAPFEVIDQDGEKVRFSPPDGLRSVVNDHQVWRLVSPALIHSDGIHLLFNVIMLMQFGAAFESKHGTGRFVAFFVVVAAASNVAQFYLGWLAHPPEWPADHPRSED